MSRLQVGGLALIINAQIKENIGNIVCLIGYRGAYFGINDAWEVECQEMMMTVCGVKSTKGFISAKNLMPLGDQQTQDELRKEELENV